MGLLVRCKSQKDQWVLCKYNFNAFQLVLWFAQYSFSYFSYFSFNHRYLFQLTKMSFSILIFVDDNLGAHTHTVLWECAFVAYVRAKIKVKRLCIDYLTVSFDDCDSCIGFHFSAATLVLGSIKYKNSLAFPKWDLFLSVSLMHVEAHWGWVSVQLYADAPTHQAILWLCINFIPHFYCYL